MSELVQLVGVGGAMVFIFLIAMIRMENAYNERASRLEESTQERAKSDNEFRYAQLEMFRGLLTELQKQRELEAVNRSEDIKRNEENFAQYEGLVASIAANHTMLAQNQNSSLTLLDEIKSLFVIDTAIENRSYSAVQRVEAVVTTSSEVLNQNTMQLEDIVNRLGEVMETLGSLESKIDNLSINAATKNEIAEIQRQIGELKVEVAALAKAISALQHDKQDKPE